MWPSAPQGSVLWVGWFSIEGMLAGCAEREPEVVAKLEQPEGAHGAPTLLRALLPSGPVRALMFTHLYHNH